MARARLRRPMTIVRIMLLLIVASTLLGAGAARGDTASGGLGGFTGSAGASGMHVTYAPRGLLPTGPPIDLGSPDALATIASGPATFARASVADPGDLLANPDALLTLGSSDWRQGTIPPYPYRVSASSGVGEPTAESNPAPGLSAIATAEGDRSSAEATMPALDAPAFATVGSMASYATTLTDGSTVTVHSRSLLDNVDVLGVLKIDSVVTDLTAVSDGGKPDFDGGTTVTGATLLDTPVTIDEDGVRGAVGGVDANQILRAVGLRVTLPGPVELEGDESGQLASTGLRIDIDQSDENVPGLTAVLDALPPMDPINPNVPSGEDLIELVRARHLVFIELGRGVVALDARTIPPLPDLPDVPSLTPPVPTASPDAPLPDLSTPPAPPASTGTVTTPTAEVADLSFGTGIGAFAVVLLLLQPLIGDRLARIGALQLATDHETCTWERP